MSVAAPAQPFLRDWSAQADANGNAKIAITPSAAYDTSFTVAGQGTGIPIIWTLYRNGSFILPGSGPNIGLGPIRFRANDTLIIQVTGAKPLTTLSGSIWGFMATTSDGSDLRPESAISNSSTWPTTQNQVQLGTFTMPANSVGGRTYDIGPAYYAIAISLDGRANCSVLQVIGIQTGITYLSVAPNNIPNPVGNTPAYFVAPINSAWDTQIRVSVTTTAAGPATPYVSQIQNPEAMFMLVAQGNLQTTLEKANPAPWQAPVSTAEGQVNLLAGGVSTIVAGGAGQTIYLHAASLYTPDAGGGIFALRDLPGAAPAVEIGRGANPGQGQVFQHDYKGKPLRIGDSLELFNPAGAPGNVYYTVDYTQV